MQASCCALQKAARPVIGRRQPAAPPHPDLAGDLIDLLQRLPAGIATGPSLAEDRIQSQSWHPYALQPKS